MNATTKMTTTTKTIYIYNENCVLAGREVPQSKLDDNPGSWDWTGYEATQENVDFYSERGTFGRKVASVLREYV